MISMRTGTTSVGTLSYTHFLLSGVDKGSPPK